MAEELTHPLLALVKEQGLIDDLQYEEVTAEYKRSGKSPYQILQDSGMLDMDGIVQTIANHLSAEVVEINERELTPQVIQTIPPKTARMYQVLPIREDGGILQVALVDPLTPARLDELNFVLKRDFQLVVADPEKVQKAIAEETFVIGELVKGERKVTLTPYPKNSGGLPLSGATRKQV